MIACSIPFQTGITSPEGSKDYPFRWDFRGTVIKKNKKKGKKSCLELLNKTKKEKKGGFNLSDLKLILRESYLSKPESTIKRYRKNSQWMHYGLYHYAVKSCILSGGEK